MNTSDVARSLRAKIGSFQMQVVVTGLPHSGKTDFINSLFSILNGERIPIEVRKANNEKFSPYVKDGELEKINSENQSGDMCLSELDINEPISSNCACIILCISAETITSDAKDRLDNENLRKIQTKITELQNKNKNGNSDSSPPPPPLIVVVTQCEKFTKSSNCFQSTGNNNNNNNNSPTNRSASPISTKNLLEKPETAIVAANFCFNKLNGAIGQDEIVLLGWMKHSKRTHDGDADCPASPIDYSYSSQDFRAVILRKLILKIAGAGSIFCKKTKKQQTSNNNNINTNADILRSFISLRDNLNQQIEALQLYDGQHQEQMAAVNNNFDDDDDQQEQHPIQDQRQQYLLGNQQLARLETEFCNTRFVFQPSEVEIYHNEVLGKGAYGSVVAGIIRTLGNRRIAAKIFTSDDLALKEAKCYGDLMRHSNNSSNDNNSGITHVYGVTVTTKHNDNDDEDDDHENNNNNNNHSKNSSIVLLMERANCDLVKLLNRSVNLNPMQNDVENSSSLLLQSEDVEQANSRQKSSLTLSQVERFSLQIAKTLQFLHTPTRDKKRIIHCDLKPGNILVFNNEIVKIVDFGSVLHTEAGEATVRVLHCTDAYSPPEYFTAVATKAKTVTVTPAFDVFSFGMILMQMLSHQNRPEFHDFMTLERGQNVARDDIELSSPFFAESREFLRRRSCLKLSEEFRENELLLERQKERMESLFWVEDRRFRMSPAENVNQYFFTSEFLEISKLIRLCEKCLMADPKQRPQHGGELVRELTQIFQERNAFEELCKTNYLQSRIATNNNNNSGSEIIDGGANKSLAWQLVTATGRLDRGGGLGDATVLLPRTSRSCVSSHVDAELSHSVHMDDEFGFGPVERLAPSPYRNHDDSEDDGSGTRRRNFASNVQRDSFGELTFPDLCDE